MNALVFIHAVTRDRHDFDDFSQGLNGMRIEAVDLMGHGRAPAGPRYLIEDYAAAINVPSGAVLYGHSLGGVVALSLAARLGDRVRGLIMEDPPLYEGEPTRMRGGPFERGFQLLRAQKRDPVGPVGEAAWTEIVKSWPGARPGDTLSDEGPNVVSRRARQLDAFDPAVIDPLLDGSLSAAFNVDDAIRHTRCPITCLIGERALGSAITETDIQRLARHGTVNLAHASGAGHYLHDAVPALCRTAIDEANR